MASAAPGDVPGTLALTAGVGAVLFGLSRGEADGLVAVSTLAPLAAGLALLALFAGSSAAPPRRCCRRAPPCARGLARATFAALAITGTTSPAMFLCVLHVQRDGGVAPAEAGLLFAPLNLAVIEGSLAGPRVTARAGERAAMAGGLMAIAAAAAWLAAGFGWGWAGAAAVAAVAALAIAGVRRPVAAGRGRRSPG